MPNLMDEDGRVYGAMMALVEDSLPNEGQEENWLIDSGATIHVTNDDTGMTDTEPSRQVVAIGDGRELIPKKKGRLS
jgi:hypothetical protein